MTLPRSRKGEAVRAVDAAVIVDRKFSMWAGSYSEYQKLIEENDLDEKMITYDKVRFLGGFDCFALQTVLKNDYSLFYMGFSNGFSLNVCGKSYVPVYGEYIYDDSDVPVLKDEEICPWNMRKMRNTKDRDHGKYLYKGIQYNYVCGRLNSVKWENEEYYFSFGLDHGAKYPGCGFMNVLMNLHTAPDAIAYFNTRVK